ncbi:hypothetical protein [Jannaschia pohangensis]|uniref:Glyceraldehyde-3-phosphate dehydrogenase n=1 Tax=Jannaschia pohangensis TaxID=390807 RepID=A0A1I3HQB3_9RHOB|nr:hypothetical protein [Jannaschia pohangensis]SFI37813.1 hypothetical protein SAMN04488095_0677 [Jannaschia pohangensis]
MNNMTAVILALLLIAFFLADYLFNGAGIATFLGRRMIDLIEYIAFWR